MGLLEAKGPILEVPQDDDFGFQFRESCGSRRLIDDGLFRLLGLDAGNFIDVVGVVGRYDGAAAEVSGTGLTCHPLFAKPIFQALTPSLQRAMYRGWRRRKPPLEYLQCKAHARPALVVATSVGTIHFFPNVIRDGLIEFGFRWR